jgi:predicted aldo/keto reductase-like oxidoreductase
LIFERLEKQETETLGSDRCRQCYQCLPCPEAINIPEVLRLRNLAIAYNMKEFGQYRYQMFENAGHWFPGKKGNRCTECGDCLPRCPEKLEIPKLLKDSHQRLNGSPRRRLWEA